MKNLKTVFEAQEREFWNQPSFRRLTADLRDKTGRLDPEKIGIVYGLTVSEVAKASGIGVRTLKSTPNASVVQKKLEMFAMIAKLRSFNMLRGEKFQQWLGLQVPDYDQQTPIEMIKSGKGWIVENSAANMLLGNPQ